MSGINLSMSKQGVTPDPEPAPRVIKEDAVTGATAATAARSLVRVDTKGRYRLSAILFCTTGGDAITATLNVLNTDRVGAVTQAVVSAFSLNAAARQPGRIEFEASAGSVIQWNVTLSGARVASVHDAVVILERLKAQ